MMKKLLNIILSIILIVSFVPGFASARSQGYESLNFSKDQASAAVADFELANNNENSTNKSTGNEFEACAYYLSDSDYLIKGYEYNNLYFFGYKNSDLEGKIGIVKYNWANTGTNTVATESPFKAASNCEKIIFDKSVSNIKPASCCCWFYEFDSCKEISGLEYLNTSNVTDMSHMFNGYANNVPISPTLNISNWDTSKVVNMSYMFSNYACNAQISINLDLSKWDTSNVADMSYMFSNYACNARILLKLDVSNWDTSNVINMSYMFNGFAMCSDEPATIYASDKFVVKNDANSKNMFLNSRIRGGAGTTYDPEHINADGACIDKHDKDGNSIWGDNKGYFTGNASDTEKYTIVFKANLSERNNSVKNLQKSIDVAYNDSLPSVVRVPKCQGYIFTGFSYSYVGANGETLPIQIYNNKGELVKDVDILGFNDLPHKIFLDANWTEQNSEIKDCAYYVESTKILDESVRDLYQDNTLYFFGYVNSDLENKVGVIKYGWATRANSFVSPFLEAVKCTKIVFDESAKNINPQSCQAWFNNFKYCEEISGLEYLNVSNVKSMKSMFSNFASEAKTAPKLDLRSWDIKKVNDKSYMFSEFSKNTSEPGTIYVSDRFFDQDNGDYGKYDYMFSNSNIQGGAGTMSITNPSINGRSGACIDKLGSKWGKNKGYFTGDKVAVEFFAISADGTLPVTAMYDLDSVFVLPNMPNLTFHNGLDFIGWAIDNPSGEIKKPGDIIYLTKYTRVWAMCANAASGYAYYLNKEISGYEANTLYFYGYKNLKLEGKSGVTKYSWADTGTNIIKSPFADASGCTKVVFDESVKNIKPVSCCCWFYNFVDCVEIDGLENLNTSNVIDMSHMFSACASFVSSLPVTLNVSNWDTSKVVNMSHMFSSCVQNINTSITLDLGKWDTSSVTDMSYMFSLFSMNAQNPPILNVSNWNTSKVENMSFMFNGFAKNSCESATIYASDKFVVQNGADSKNMFLDSKIKGGAGTTYDSEHINADAACIDMPNGTIWGKNKGYLTAENIVKADVYTISFNTDQNLPNGIKAENKPSSIQVAFGSVITESINPPTCNNFEFDGFYYTEDGNEFSTEKLYFNADGSPVENMVWDIPSDATLVAKWDAISYDVSFDLNLPEDVTLDENYTLSSVKASFGSSLDKLTSLPQWSGHKFAGFYYVTGEGESRTEKQYFNSKGEFVVKAWNIPSSVTLVAKWDAIFYDVSFDTNGGNFVDDTYNITSYTSDKVTSLPTEEQIIKVGYSFMGWYSDSEFKNGPVYNIPLTAVGEKKFWAKWEAISYIIDFNLEVPNGNSVDCSLSPLKVTYGTQLKDLETVPKCDGYTFKGFYYVNSKNDSEKLYFNADGTAVENLVWDFTNNVVLVAKWEENSYTLTLNTNGGVIDNKFIIDSYIHGQTTFLPSKGQITKEGFIFEGWYYNEKLTGRSIVSISGEATGNKVFWAKWKKVNHRQHFCGVM